MGTEWTTRSMDKRLMVAWDPLFWGTEFLSHPGCEGQEAQVYGIPGTLGGCGQGWAQLQSKISLMAMFPEG